MLVIQLLNTNSFVKLVIPPRIYKLWNAVNAADAGHPVIRCGKLYKEEFVPVQLPAMTATKHRDGTEETLVPKVICRYDMSTKDPNHVVRFQQLSKTVTVRRSEVVLQIMKVNDDVRFSGSCERKVSLQPLHGRRNTDRLGSVCRVVV